MVVSHGSEKGLEVGVDKGSGSSGVGCGVGNVGKRRLLLFLLPFLAEAAVCREMHATCHMVHAPMVGVLPNHLAFLVTVLGRHPLPLVILLLLGLVTTLLLVARLLVARLLVARLLVFVEGIFEIFVGLEVSLESFD
jgi:hypothetical protein